MSFPLTSEMREAGENLVRELDRRKFLARAALWLYSSEVNDWRLVIATPQLHSTGPRKIYKALQLIISRMETPIQLGSVALVDAKDPLIKLLSTAVNTGTGVSGIRFSGNTINGHFIEDAYIYRIAA